MTAPPNCPCGMPAVDWGGDQIYARYFGLCHKCARKISELRGQDDARIRANARRRQYRAMRRNELAARRR